MKIINMMCKTIVSVLLLLFVALVTAEAQVTAIRAGKVVDPETGTILNNQTILVEGRDIKAIGADVKIPAGATVIDLSCASSTPMAVVLPVTVAWMRC